MPNSDFFRSLGLPKEMAGELDADARTTEAESQGGGGAETPFLYQYLLEGAIDPEATFVESNVDGVDDRTLTLANGTTDGHEMTIQINGSTGSTTVLNASMRHREDGDLGSIDFNDVKERFVKLRWEADIERWRILERNVNFGSETTGPTGNANGDLSGTYPNPSVAAITEQGGPSSLPIGAIADGQILKRVGTDIVGVAPPVASYPATGGFVNLGSGDIAFPLTCRIATVAPNDQTISVSPPVDSAAHHGTFHTIRVFPAADPGVVVHVNFGGGASLFLNTSSGVGQSGFDEPAEGDFMTFVWDHTQAAWCLAEANFTRFLP